MKKFLFIFLILILLLPSCSKIHASEYTDSILPGKWNIEGTSFVEKEFVRISFKIEGEMNQETDFLKNLDENIDKILSSNQEIFRNVINENRKVLTSCDIDLKIYMFDKAGFDIKVWEGKIDNAVEIPILLPEARPTLSDPFELPTRKIQDLNLTLTFTSESSGKLRVKGYADFDTVGTCEVNADCALWKDGTLKPSIEEETSSGCNSIGVAFACMAALLIIEIGRGKKICSEQI